MPARRFLAPQARAGNGHGYLSQPEREYPQAPDPPDVVARISDRTAMCDEPEAPSGAWVDAEAELAAERNRVRLLKQAENARGVRACLSMEHRMLDARRRAKLKHIDVSHEMHKLKKMLDRGKQDAARERLESVEALLDGVTGLEEAA